MGVRHRSLMVEGVQFHPESILTPEGPRLMQNFLDACERRRVRARSARARRRARPCPLTLRELLEMLLERRDLSEPQAQELLAHLTNPESAPAMSGAILAALRTKGVDRR